MDQLKPNELIGPLWRTLALLQMLEHVLRLYVGTAEALICAARPYGVAYRVDEKRINGASLGTLVRMFEKLNRNDDLISRLRRLPEDRNYIAHVAFRRSVPGLPYDKVDSNHAKTHADEVGDEVEKLLELMRQELGAVLVNFPLSLSANR